MTRNPVVAVVAVVVLIVALFIILRQFGTGTRGNPSDAFWYDVEKKTLFPHEGVISPIEAPSGGQGVRAFVYACKSCDDDNDRFIGYLQRYTEEGKQYLETELAKERPDPMARMTANAYLEIRREDDTEWYLNQEEIGAIKADIKQRCGGKNAILCKTFQD